MLFLGPVVTISMEKEPFKVHNEPTHPVITRHGGQNWSKNLLHFCALSCTPMGNFFSNFSVMCWVKCIVLISAQILETCRLIFHYLLFLPVFLAFGFLAHFAHFVTPPWVTPHQLWPQIVLLCPLSSSSLWRTLLIEFITDFEWFLSKWWFFHFESLWPLRSEEPPLYQCSKHLGAEGPHLRVPPLHPGPTPSPAAYTPGGDFVTSHPVVLGIY